jgi:O-acetyl-ADP-ribose deacetylase (regulator of RNase III)
MNVRMPKDVTEEFLEIQDEYLKRVTAEKGITDINDLVPVKDDIYLWKGDITTLRCAAIVNAANSAMLGCFVPGHNCIDNCIHTFAGVQLRNECHQKMEELRKVYGKNYVQPTAVPMLTEAYNLPADKIIHVVGPIVDRKLNDAHERLLAECYRSCLDITKENHIDSVAFCCISTGVFMFPQDRAAEIAIATVSSFLKDNKGIKVVFNVFNDIDFRIYSRLLSRSS